jgi:hypothetical protein
MEQTPCSETSVIKHHTPGNNQKDYTQRLEHGESLKSRIHAEVFISIISNMLYISTDELTNHYSRM